MKEKKKRMDLELFWKRRLCYFVKMHTNFVFQKYVLSPKVVDDEIYFFRKPIALEKVKKKIDKIIC